MRFAAEDRFMLVGRKAVFRLIVNPCLAGGQGKGVAFSVAFLLRGYRMGEGRAWNRSRICFRTSAVSISETSVPN